MCVEFLDWFFDEDDDFVVDVRLVQLKICFEYWFVLKKSWYCIDLVEDLSLVICFDLVVIEDGQIKLIEINGEILLLGVEIVY